MALAALTQLLIRVAAASAAAACYLAKICAPPPADLDLIWRASEREREREPRNSLAATGLAKGRLVLTTTQPLVAARLRAQHLHALLHALTSWLLFCCALRDERREKRRRRGCCEERLASASEMIWPPDCGGRRNAKRLIARAHTQNLLIKQVAGRRSAAIKFSLG